MKAVCWLLWFGVCQAIGDSNEAKGNVAAEGVIDMGEVTTMLERRQLVGVLKDKLNEEVRTKSKVVSDEISEETYWCPNGGSLVVDTELSEVDSFLSEVDLVSERYSLPRPHSFQSADSLTDVGPHHYEPYKNISPDDPMAYNSLNPITSNPAHLTSLPPLVSPIHERPLMGPLKHVQQPPSLQPPLVSQQPTAVYSPYISQIPISVNFDIPHLTQSPYPTETSHLTHSLQKSQIPSTLRYRNPPMCETTHTFEAEPVCESGWSLTYTDTGEMRCEREELVDEVIEPCDEGWVDYEQFKNTYGELGGPVEHALTDPASFMSIKHKQKRSLSAQRHMVWGDTTLAVEEQLNDEESKKKKGKDTHMTYVFDEMTKKQQKWALTESAKQSKHQHGHCFNLITAPRQLQCPKGFKTHPAGHCVRWEHFHPEYVCPPGSVPQSYLCQQGDGEADRRGPSDGIGERGERGDGKDKKDKSGEKENKKSKSGLSCSLSLNREKKKDDKKDKTNKPSDINSPKNSKYNSSKQSSDLPHSLIHQDTQCAYTSLSLPQLTCVSNKYTLIGDSCLNEHLTKLSYLCDDDTFTPIIPDDPNESPYCQRIDKTKPTSSCAPGQEEKAGKCRVRQVAPIAASCNSPEAHLTSFNECLSETVKRAEASCPVGFTFDGVACVKVADRVRATKDRTPPKSSHAPDSLHSTRSAHLTHSTQSAPSAHSHPPYNS
eukprot:GHVN01041379.1.p1 GENE.GHVN01041379.1~~GHVN01041379.1.p1  ORF type:complete len:715 (-),score=217.55 GHVN01041379.1:429-2573(-)